MRITWWKWGLGGLGLVVLAFAAMYGVGALLPAGHTATVSAHVDADPEAVWALITEVERFPDWRPDVEAVTRLPDRDGMVWRETQPTGSITFAAEAVDPPRRLVARIADEGLPFGGTWTYRLAPDGAGTRLTITEDGEVYNPMFRFMARFVFGHDGTMRTYVQAVRDALEPGTERAP